MNYHGMSSRQIPTCTRCKSPLAVVDVTVEHNHHGEQCVYPVFQCPNCGAVFSDAKNYQAHYGYSPNCRIDMTELDLKFSSLEHKLLDQISEVREQMNNDVLLPLRKKVMEFTLQ